MKNTSKKLPTTENLDGIHQWFTENGITIADWAKERGFNPALVYLVLKGKRKCIRGQSHYIAMALGLKLPSGCRKMAKLDSMSELHQGK